MNYKCDKCGSSDTYIKIKHNTFKKNNHIIEFDSDTRFCKKCDSEVYDSKLDNYTIDTALKMYNQKYGISEDIKKIRNEMGLSLEELSNVIGCAKKTLISYEKGESIPNDTYMIIIKTILDNPETIKLFINANKDMYDVSKLNKINEKLNNYFSNNSKSLFNNKENEASDYNGYSDTNINKLTNIISILSKDSMNKTKIIKELFYIDFLNYKLHLYSITGLEYSKLPYGPVIDDFENIFETLSINNIIKYEKKYKDNYEEHIITNNSEIDYDIFTNDELDIINKVKKYFKDYTVKDIVDYSHLEKAFIETKIGSKISYDYAFELNIPIK